MLFSQIKLFTDKSIKPNYIKVHNTYYNNMVCYINNKQSDTDSHQSKVNNHSWIM